MSKDQKSHSYEQSSIYLRTGLPDGIFSNQKSQFWRVAVEDVGIIYSHLVYLMAIEYILLILHMITSPFW
jgi:hypothetical protein